MFELRGLQKEYAKVIAERDAAIAKIGPMARRLEAAEAMCCCIEPWTSKVGKVEGVSVDSTMDAIDAYARWSSIRDEQEENGE